MKILIFGAKGLIGRSLFNQLRRAGYDVIGTIRHKDDISFFDHKDSRFLEITGEIKCDNFIIKLIEKVKPAIIINCLGITKHVSGNFKTHQLIEINSQFPHFLSFFANDLDYRMISFGTDCVFSGKKGDYTENDISDAEDLYGKSKFLGEVYDSERVLPLRTSFVGHSAQSQLGLIDWFLSASGSVKGFKRAIYTGLTTIELGNFLMNYIFENNNLSGLYNLSGPKITKYDLLKLVKKTYSIDTNIEPEEDIFIDRSLDSSKLRAKTNYSSPSWEETILEMFEDFNKVATK